MAATSPLASPAHLVSASETPSACLLASLAYFVFGTQVSIITYLPDPGGSEGPWAPSTSPACHTPPHHCLPSNASLPVSSAGLDT